VRLPLAHGFLDSWLLLSQFTHEGRSLGESLGSVCRICRFVLLAGAESRNGYIKGDGDGDCVAG